MKVVIAPNAFKGTLAAAEVARAIADRMHELHPEWEIVEVPMADGGDGTVEAVLAALPGRRIRVAVKSPLLADITADFAVLDDGKTAVIEMAQASGLTLVPEELRNPLVTTTYGTGELVRRAIEEGCSKVFIGIGGSATVDGGAGMATVLGVRFLDDKGRNISFGGGGLAQLHRIDFSGRIDLSGVEITALSDVTNPLLGENGAARVFAPQKGATPEMVEELERNLAHLSEVIKRDLGVDVAEIPGAGAAGGLGAGIVAFLNGKIVPGIDAVIDLVSLRDKVRGADLMITGEGSFDCQTPSGKAPLGVAGTAREFGVPSVLICGRLGEESRETAEGLFLAVLSLTELAGSQREAILNPKRYLNLAVARFLVDHPPPWPRIFPHAPVRSYGGCDCSVSLKAGERR
ncbi:MAG: glycerate kinase [bacterium]|nr:glycerate kinase [bacterium]